MVAQLPQLGKEKILPFNHSGLLRLQHSQICFDHSKPAFGLFGPYPQAVNPKGFFFWRHKTGGDARLLITTWRKRRRVGTASPTNKQSKAKQKC